MPAPLPGCALPETASVRVPSRRAKRSWSAARANSSDLRAGLATVHHAGVAQRIEHAAEVLRGQLDEKSSGCRRRCRASRRARASRCWATWSPPRQSAGPAVSARLPAWLDRNWRGEAEVGYAQVQRRQSRGRHAGQRTGRIVGSSEGAGGQYRRALEVGADALLQQGHAGGMRSALPSGPLSAICRPSLPVARAGPGHAVRARPRALRPPPDRCRAGRAIHLRRRCSRPIQPGTSRWPSLAADGQTLVRNLSVPRCRRRGDAERARRRGQARAQAAIAQGEVEQGAIQRQGNAQVRRQGPRPRPSATGPAG